MENHHHDHEEPKPSNKWIATPILMAVFVIGLVSVFLSMQSTACCQGSCKDKANTEQHGNEHGTTDEHATTNGHGEETNVADTTKTATEPTGHEGHGEGDGHGH